MTGVTGASGVAVPPVSPPEDELPPPLLSGVVGRDGWFGAVSPPEQNGTKYEREGEGVVAQCFCHETEHLDGHLFIEKVEEYVDVEMPQEGEE